MEATTDDPIKALTARFEAFKAESDAKIQALEAKIQNSSAPSTGETAKPLIEQADDGRVTPPMVNCVAVVGSFHAFTAALMLASAIFGSNDETARIVLAA